MTESFHWSGSGLQKAQFHALANLLSLCNGGQVESASLPDDILEDDYEDDDSASLDSATVQRLSNSGHDGLKKKFLDCLAEFAANKRGGKTVACTAMREFEDNVTIWIARNDGFLVEEEVFERLSLLLSALSCNDVKLLILLCSYTCQILFT
jgi:hypothetical protein